MKDANIVIIDATDLILGRLATYAAKEALNGNFVRVINSEKAVITGKKKDLFDEFLARFHRGTWSKGPKLDRMPDKIVRRSIRGMIPFEKARGKDAYSRIFCYVGVPEVLKDKKAVVLEGANKSKIPNLHYLDIKSISKRLGAKIE